MPTIVCHCGHQCIHVNSSQKIKSEPFDVCNVVPLDHITDTSNRPNTFKYCAHLVCIYMLQYTYIILYIGHTQQFSYWTIGLAGLFIGIGEIVGMSVTSNNTWWFVCFQK